MSNVQSLPVPALADHTQEIYLDLVLDYEKDSDISGNLITVIVASEYRDFKLSVLVTMSDTVETVKDRFDSQFAETFEEIESMERWDRDNYEHPSITQGRAFDSLTC